MSVASYRATSRFVSCSSITSTYVALPTVGECGSASTSLARNSAGTRPQLQFHARHDGEVDALDRICRGVELRVSRWLALVAALVACDLDLDRLAALRRHSEIVVRFAGPYIFSRLKPITC